MIPDLDTVKKRLAERHPWLTLEEYPTRVNGRGRPYLRFHCEHQHQDEALLDDLMRATRKGCRKCSDLVRDRRPADDYAAAVQRRTPHIRLLEPYRNKRTKVRAYCDIHNVEWQPWPQHLLKAPGCPECGKASSRAANTKRSDDYRARVLAANPKVQVDSYRHSNERVAAHCDRCGHDWQPVAYTLYEHGCPNCAVRQHSSRGEQELQTFLRGLGCDVLDRWRPAAVAKGSFEADAYLPQHRLAVDYHGMYNHSEARRDSRYHLRKTEYFESQGIQLIQVLEQEWLSSRPIVESLLRAKTGMVGTSIAARKCQILVLDRDTKAAFLAKNHIQGDDTCRHSFGLMHAGDLVAVMTFALPPISGSNRSHDWYLSRFAVRQNTAVVGGFSRLLRYFINEHQPSSIATFADRRFSSSNRNVYLTNGFQLLHATRPNYWYFKSGHPSQKFHRFGFRKSVLSRKLQNFDPLLSEHQNMLQHGWLRIYDAGNLAYRLSL